LSWISPRVIRGNRGDIASRYCILSELITAGVDMNAVFATRPEHVPSALRGRLISYGPIYNLWPRLEGLRAFLRSRYVVWTGGLDLQDDSSLVKLVHMWIVFASYRALGLRIVLAMQGAGPLTTPTGRWLARRVLALVDAALLRDQGSFELVAGLAKQEKLLLAHDGIFLSGLRTDVEDNLEQSPRFETKPRIGLNLRLWFHFANSWIPYQFARKTYLARAEKPISRIVDSLAALIRHLRLEHNAEILLLSMYEPGIEPWEDDGPLLDRLKSLFVEDEGVVLFRDDVTIESFADTVGRLDLMIGTRLHSALIALRMGVPALHIAYTDKGRAIYDDLGIADWIIGIDELLDSPEPLIKLTDEVLSSPQALSRVSQVVARAVEDNKKALRAAIARMELS
jgi:polysaccharide pyruvyl transferase WcaK-like protein